MPLNPIILKNDHIEPLLGVTRNPTTKAVLTYGLVGKYTYPNGYQDAAIAIGNPPTGIKAEGLEVIINPFETKESLFTDPLVHIEEIIRISLIQRDVTKLNILIQARHRFKRLGLWKYRDFYVPPSDIVQNFPAYNIAFAYREGEERAY